MAHEILDMLNNNHLTAKMHNDVLDVIACICDGTIFDWFDGKKWLGTKDFEFYFIEARSNELYCNGLAWKVRMYFSPKSIWDEVVENKLPDNQKNLKGFDRKKPYTAYLQTVYKHAMDEDIKHKRKELPVGNIGKISDAAGGSVPSDIEQVDLEDSMNAAFSQLSNEELNIVMMRWQYGMTIDDVCNELNITKYKVLQATESGKDKLQCKLKKEGWQNCE
jgi:DNA-directed RNA polymerase specialized sigma24 family protein